MCLWGFRFGKREAGAQTEMEKNKIKKKIRMIILEVGKKMLHFFKLDCDWKK